MEQVSKETNGDIIAGILNSITNCNDCPLYHTCNDIEVDTGSTLCQLFKENDNLSIVL